jgi:hypothetical protein
MRGTITQLCAISPCGVQGQLPATSLAELQEYHELGQLFQSFNKVRTLLTPTNKSTRDPSKHLQHTKHPADILPDSNRRSQARNFA